MGGHPPTRHQAGPTTTSDRPPDPSHNDSDCDGAGSDGSDCDHTCSDGTGTGTGSGSDGSDCDDTGSDGSGGSGVRSGASGAGSGGGVVVGRGRRLGAPRAAPGKRDFPGA
ncbi:hypothetical protein [Streptomyces sp. NPDC054804]